MKLIFGGYISGADGSRNQLGPLVDPDDEAVKKTVTLVAGNTGVLGLRHDPTPKSGPCELILYAENGRLLLMLNEHAVDGEHNTRTLTDNSLPNKLVSILGEMYPAKAVTNDLKLACRMFREFAHSGTVANGSLT